MKPTDDDYARLLAFRQGMREFLHWSEQLAEVAGLTPAQHQLLLVIRGSGEKPGPTIGRISEALLLKHHSAVELVDRAQSAGLVERARDPDDGRVVRVTITKKGLRRLEPLTTAHLEQLRELAPTLESLLHAVTVA